MKKHKHFSLAMASAFLMMPGLYAGYVYLDNINIGGNNYSNICVEDPYVDLNEQVKRKDNKAIGVIAKWALGKGYGKCKNAKIIDLEELAESSGVDTPMFLTTDKKNEKLQKIRKELYDKGYKEALVKAVFAMCGNSGKAGGNIRSFGYDNAYGLWVDKMESMCKSFDGNFEGYESSLEVIALEGLSLSGSFMANANPGMSFNWLDEEQFSELASYRVDPIKLDDLFSQDAKEIKDRE